MTASPLALALVEIRERWAVSSGWRRFGGRANTFLKHCHAAMPVHGQV